MEYLKIRVGSRKRKDGTPYAVPLYVRKTRKYGKTLEEEPISRKRPILVVGAHGSGKTRWVERLHEKAKEIWGAKVPVEPLYLSGLTPLSAWMDGGPVPNWWNGSKKKSEPLWYKLRQWEKTDLLPRYVAETGAVVFLDDAHKLTGRKLDIAKRCLMPAKIWVVSSSQENRIPPSLRIELMRSDPQVYELSSDVAYDRTGAFIWIFVGMLLIAGFWELAIAVGGLKALAAGRRATRQD
uniref:AAA domain-containing protein n=1 Tax=Candidatus Kentrum sp. LFY TaxID=2126342 RepID=A0A450UN89_9GAMM|nr:MAG: hypothetical protein BECKLFY1418A_GA0070994_103611 [Candidatus Kentron sp. LFY]